MGGGSATGLRRPGPLGPSLKSAAATATRWRLKRLGTTRTSQASLPLAEYVATDGGVSASCPGQKGQETLVCRLVASTNSFGRVARSSQPMITQRRDNGSWRYSDMGDAA